jgi:hypothetical protein
MVVDLGSNLHTCNRVSTRLALTLRHGFGGLSDMYSSSSSSAGREKRNGREHSLLPASPATDVHPARKRLIICCDGTTNDGVNTEKPITNVARIARCIKNDHIVQEADGSRTSLVQIVMYMRGVATGTSSAANAVDILGGRGMSKHVPRMLSLAPAEVSPLLDVKIFLC